jgi:hypothetical protein
LFFAELFTFILIASIMALFIFLVGIVK